MIIMKHHLCDNPKVTPPHVTEPNSHILAIDVLLVLPIALNVNKADSSGLKTKMTVNY